MSFNKIYVHTIMVDILFGGIENVNTGSRLDVDVAQRLENDFGLPYRDPADTKSLRELALAEESASGRIRSLIDHAFDLVGNLVI